MKKVVSLLLLICTVCIFLISCDENNTGDTNEPVEKTDVEKVEELIENITSADTCYEAATAYYALTEAKQGEVKNNYVLENEIRAYSADSRLWDYHIKNQAVWEANKFHDKLKNKLLNIDSYTVNEQNTVVFYDENTEQYYLYIQIDYSAQNKMGGYTRYENNAEYYVWENNSWEIIDYTPDTAELIKKIYTWKFKEYTRYDLTYNKN